MGARRACKLVDDTPVDDSPVDDSRAVDSPVDDSRAVDSPVDEIQVAFLSLVDRELGDRELGDRALELGDRELGDRALELADRVCQVGQDSVDFRCLLLAVLRDDRAGQDSVDFRCLLLAVFRDVRVGRALSRAAQAESLRAAAPDEFPVETVAQAESPEPFQVDWVLLGVSLVGWFLVALRPAYTNSA
jgi:hypothetical protein